VDSRHRAAGIARGAVDSLRRARYTPSSVEPEVFSMASVYDFTVRTIDGEEESMADFHGKPLLIVNVASKCGFTPQYTGLEALYRKYRERGLEVLGFPCDQFGHQEPGNEEEIKNFCRLNYDVTFPLFAKIDVNGPAAHPLYEHLKHDAKGILGTEAIKWNFTKFLVGRDGEVVKRFAPNDKPEDLEKDIEAVL
jgi:glutathione peroxidase